MPSCARSLEIPFFDLDKEVEAFYHESIPRLQAKYIKHEQLSQ